MKPAKEKNEWRLAPGWKSAPPESLAMVWMQSALFSTPKIDDDAEWTGVLDAAGTLQNLLLPVVALKFYGSADSIRKKIIAVLEAVAIFRNFPGFIVDGPDGGLRAVSAIDGSDLERFAAKLRLIYFRLEAAEKYLQRKGWKFNPATKKVSRIAKKHRGKDLLAECVRAIYTAKHREEYTGASAAKKLLIRRKIAAVLVPYFDAEELRTDTEAPIYRAIDKRERRSR